MEAKQKAQLEKLGFTLEEIAEIETADKAIDRGEKLFELPPELEAGAKKARQADRKQTVPAKREKKIDNDKRFIIDSLISTVVADTPAQLVQGDLMRATLLAVPNLEREFLFTYNGKKYKITLSCPRS